MKAKQFLFWLHRWLGIAMCLLFALWFASGVVMMYVEYPELTEEERLGYLPLVDLDQVHLTPFEAASQSGSGALVTAIKLTTVLGRPAFEIMGVDRQVAMVFADSGEAVREISADLALIAARGSGFAAVDSSVTYDALVDIDQWSITAVLNPHRPLHRIRMNDGQGSVVYISSRTGQVVLDTSRDERFWNWLGSTIHWIYPLVLRKNAPLWTQVIVYASLLGIFSVITGGIIGFMRIRVSKRYRGEGFSPYRGWMKWHHLLGLFSLIFVSTFIFSGLMSMGPWGIFNSATSPMPQLNRYYGNDSLRLFDLPMPQSGESSSLIKEVEWHQVQGSSYYSYVSSPSRREAYFSGASAGSSAVKLLAVVSAAIPDLLPDAELESMELVSEEDNYYYSRHNNFRPFPVYRAKFDDAESTWYHIDLNNGEIVNRVTDANRLERWLFNGLHSLDFQFLIRNRPVWDVLMILLSIAGLIFSLTAVVIGWRRLLR